MLTVAPVTVLVWLDSSRESPLELIAYSGGRKISPAVAFRRLFEGGEAGAARFLPWLAEPASESGAICAYAKIEPGRVHSRFIVRPRAEDIVRLDREFRDAAKAIGDRNDDGEHERFALKIFAGTATCGDREIHLSDGEFSILAAIALNARYETREHLADALWPDRDPESAARLLKLYVHKIRAKFGHAAVIETSVTGYRIGPDVSVDVPAAEAIARNHLDGRLEDAMRSLLEGAFEGFIQSGYRRLERLDQYATLERRLQIAGIESARALVQDAWLRGDDLRALAIAERALAADRYDDVSIELIMRAQLKLGRSDAALRTFRESCDALKTELGIAPPHHLSMLFAHAASETAATR